MSMPAAGKALALLLATTLAQGPETGKSSARSPEDVLRKAGLSRSGHSYVLTSEAEAAALAKEVERLRGEVERDVRRKAAIDGDRDDDLRKAAALRKQAEQLQRQADQARKSDKDRANTLDRRARDLLERAGKFRRSDPGEKAKAKRSRDLADGRDDDLAALEKAEQRRKTLVRETEVTYAHLWKRDEIREALRALNLGRHPKDTLGPVSAYGANLIRQSIEHLADLGLDRRDDRLVLREDAGWIARTSAAFHAFLKPEDGPGTGSPASDVLKALRRDADALASKRSALAADPLVRELLEEIGGLTKSRPIVGISPAYARSLKELDAMERGARPSAAEADR